MLRLPKLSSSLFVGLTIVTLSACNSNEQFSNATPSAGAPAQLTSGEYPAPSGSTSGTGSYPGQGSNNGNGGYPGSNGNGNGGYPGGMQGGCGGSSSGSGSYASGVTGSTGGITFQNLCSNEREASQGSDVVNSSELQLTLTDSSKNVACQTSSGVRAQVVAGSLDIASDCPNLSANSYNLSLIDPSANSGNLLYGNQLDAMKSVIITRASASSAWQVFGTSSNGKQESISSLYVLYDVNNGSDSACAKSASPLVIDVSSDSAPDADLMLTSPSAGVLFDILGANSFPVPDAKKQISWIRNPAEYMFLVLPNSSGQVLGVDQLFGNNTLGPDGKFAANGFAALAKYDLNGDGVIDNKDAIFQSLRLWSDKNSDGVAQAAELMSLDDLGITSINLKYNPRFKEQDQYGNQFRYSSSVTQKGKARMIFDIWFEIGK